MTTNGGQQASPMHPPITDQTAAVKRRRFRRIKTSQPADPLTDTDSIKQPMVHPSYSLYRNAAILLLAYFAAGTLCFHLTRHQIQGTKTNSILDALYFTMITITSVGYGDLVPDSTLTILLAYLFVVSGMLIVVLVFSKAAELLVEKQAELIITALHLKETTGEAEIMENIKTKGVRNMFIILIVLLLVLLVIATSLLLWVEDLGVLHAFYCVMGTVTGAGYVDTCFSTKGGRAFALVWILATTVFIIQLVFTFASVYTERKQRALVKWILTRKPAFSDLEAADFDGDGVVSAAEFIIYKLKEMGKISQDDISPIMDAFDSLDFDQTGTLSATDLLFS